MSAVACMERALLAVLAHCAPADERESLVGDVLEAAAESREPGALAREVLRSLPAIALWRVRRLGARPLALALMCALISAGAAWMAGDRAWHFVLSLVPRRAGHAMPIEWMVVIGALAELAGMAGAAVGARLGRRWFGGRAT